MLMAIALRYAHAQFLKKVKGKYGLWMSDKMKAASKTMLEFETAKARGDNVGRLNGEEFEMVNAWYIWAVTKEFRSVDSKTNGLCTVLAVEMGAAPDIDRDSRTTAFILYGEERHAPTAKKPPRVHVTKMLVPSYKTAMAEANIPGGVVLIDAFGGGDSPEAHGFNRSYGLQKSTVMDNVKNVLETAKDEAMPVFNVTMGQSVTWKELTDRFSNHVVDIVKPAQPLFKGDASYVKSTLKAIKDFDLKYLVVMGWDANQCVAAAIFGVEQVNVPKAQAFVPGLVDYGWDVVTARNLLGANRTDILESKWGWPYIGPG
jgi:hypothetical protein